MTTNELKWYIVSKIGSRVSKNNILQNRELYPALKKVFRTSDINAILGHLFNMGFILVTDSGKELRANNIQSDYIETLKFETNELKNYVGQRTSNGKKIRQDCYNEKRRNERKYGITKAS